MTTAHCPRCGEQIEHALWARSRKRLRNGLDVGEFTRGQLEVVEHVKVGLDEFDEARLVAVVRLVTVAELEERRQRDEAFRREHVCAL